MDAQVTNSLTHPPLPERWWTGASSGTINESPPPLLLGAGLEGLIPFAAGHEIMRQRKRNLTPLIMPHERRRLRQRVDYVTSPGYGDGPGWRQRMGLPGGGPAALITTLGVFGFDAHSGAATLLSYHPHVTLDDIQHATEWPLRVASDLHSTPPPTAEELAIIRGYDPTGFWTGEKG